MDQPIVMILIGVIVGAVSGIGLLILAKKIKEDKEKARARSEADRILGKAKQEASRIEQRAKENEAKARKNVEVDLQRQKQSLAKTESRFKEKEDQLEQKYRDKEKHLETRIRDIETVAQKNQVIETRVKEQDQKVQEVLQQLKSKLEMAAHYTADQAKGELVEAVRREAEQDAAKKVLLVESEAKLDAEKKAKRIIGMAISRYAGEYTAERTVSVVALPSEEMKGRIIGKEGRNIRTIESLCGVDLIVDETPEAVVISGFDPVRREVAKRSLEKLMEDGRVHPARIEEVIQKTKSELFKSIKEDGDKACLELGISGVDQEVIKLVGSLKYRTSFTQNNYTHSIEVGFLCGLMASELNADIKQARRAGLLHDIGKALDHSVEGSHAVIGAEFAKKYHESEAICHAIRSHHEDEMPRTLLAHLAQASDALSGARPGARRHTMESYVKRLEDLESIGNSFDGVLRTFAIQAGREIRVIVEGSKVTDEQSIMLSRDIARKIEREMKYPGQIKVTVIRETRAVEHAR